MKKLKGSAVLAAFIFGVSLLFLCSFGTDAAYVILSRYKLQKITEYIAMEFAASKARDADNTVKTEDEEKKRKSIQTKYESIYNAGGSGILVFEITNMDYKADRVNKEVVVRVKTKSKVMPAFLRFAGVKEIIIYSNAYAKTNRVTIDRTIENENAADWENSRAVFNFMTNNIDASGASDDAEGITARNTGIGDFIIQFNYDDAASGSRGGFFVIAGFGNNGWTDIGNTAVNKTDDELQRVCTAGSDSVFLEENLTEDDTNAQCYFCINTAQEDAVTFDLSKDTSEIADTEGRLRRISTLWVLRAGGSGEQQSDGTYLNPCDPDSTNEEWFEKDVTVTLTILNNVTIIDKDTYDNFTTQADSLNDDDEIGSTWTRDSSS